MASVTLPLEARAAGGRHEVGTVIPMDPTARFVALAHQPEAVMPLDELALLIAAHARADLDVAAELARLDELAAGVGERSVEALCHHLFVDQGFVGDHDDYYDPANSYLDQVLERRTGIPITLAVVMIEVGRRAGVALAGVSMPGHFLVRSMGEDAVPLRLLDPFDGGATLDREACEARVRKLLGPAVVFEAAFVEPVGTATIVARMLANLDAIAVTRADRAMLDWVVRLRAAMPGSPAVLQRRLAGSLAASCQFDQAADVLERLASSEAEAEPGETLATARRLRARLN